MISVPKGGCFLARNSLIVITGLRTGGRRPTETGGVIQPCRKASNNSASERIALREGWGGPIANTGPLEDFYRLRDIRTRSSRGEVVRGPECREFLRYRHVDQLVKCYPFSFNELTRFSRSEG